MDARITALPLCAALALGACVADVDDAASPLARFDGQVRIDLDEDGALTLRLAARGDACASLTAAATVTLEGDPGEIEPGGPAGDDAPSAACAPPTIRWAPRASAAPAAGTIALADEVTAWTIALDQPTTARAFRRLGPDAPLAPGAPVTLELLPAGDALRLAAVFVDAGAASMWATDGDRLTVEGMTMTFAAPAAPAPTEGRLVASATTALRVLGCDAPGGCAARARAVSVLPIALRGDDR